MPVSRAPLYAAAALAALIGAAIPLVRNDSAPLLGTVGAVTADWLSPVSSWLAPASPSSPAAVPPPPAPAAARTVTAAPSTSAPAAPAAPSSPAVLPPPSMPPAFTCEIMDFGDGTTEARVWGPAGWVGAVLIDFSDGTADVFQSATYAVDMTTNRFAWLAVPAEDIGASVRPAYCTATASG